MILIILVGMSLDANAYTIYKKQTLVQYTDSELIIGEEYDKYGVYLMPKNETEQVRTMVVPKYDYLEKISNGDYILAEQKGRYAIIDYYGDVIIPLQWDKLELISNYPVAFKVKQGNKYGVINEYNEILIPVIMDNISEIEQLEIELEENNQRKEFTNEELLEGYKRLEKLRNPSIWSKIKKAFIRFFEWLASLFTNHSKRKK